MIKLILFLFLVTSLSPIFPEEIIRGVRFLKSNGTFSEVSDLYITNEKLTKVIETKEKNSVRYVLPSFCDAYVTLGVEATGGQSNLNNIKLSLKSFLMHGFTHIQSIADGPWIQSLKTDIDSGKIIGPKITIAKRPLITKSAELKDVSELLYYSADNKESALKEFQYQLTYSNKSIHIFNRFNEDSTFSFDSELLHQMRMEAKDKNKLLTIHTYADRISILDSLISGNRYLVHPISAETQNEIAKQHIQELNLIPLLNVYRNRQFDSSENGDGKLELNTLKKKSKYFLDNYSKSFESSLRSDLEETEMLNRKTDYSSYFRFLEKNPILINKMILGSGSGNYLSFPGISGIQELKIFAKAFNSKEELFLIPTRNSCSYMGGEYNGELAVGREANLIILKENPVQNIDTLFQIVQVFQSGKIVQFEAQTNKKPIKNRR